MSSHPRAKTVLIVDDEREILTALEVVLAVNPGQIRVLTAGDGHEAIELLASEPVDLVVTDLNMPVLDGFHVLGALMGRHPAIPAIVTTAYGSAEVRRQLDELGPLTFVEKPFDLARMAEQIRLMLGQSARGRVEGITLPGFLQLLGLESKTCSIRVGSRERSGWLDFLAGELVDAGAGDLRGEAAALEILDWEDVDIEIDSLRRGRERLIDQPLEYLLLEAARRRDETTQRIGQCSPLDAAARRIVDTFPEGALLDDAGVIVAANGADRAVTFLHDLSALRRINSRNAIEASLVDLFADSRIDGSIVPRLLASIAGSGDWASAAYWIRDNAGYQLRREHVWPAAALATGAELAGRVWECGHAVWDVDASPADAFGLRSAVAFPILDGARRVAVIELLSQERRPPDKELVTWLEQLGARLGKFIEHRRQDDRRQRAIGAEQASLTQIEALKARSQFLSEASLILGSSLDESVILGALTRLAISRIADWCILDLANPDGRLRRVAVVPADPLNLEWAEELRSAEAPIDRIGPVISAVARGGEPRLITDIAAAFPWARDTRIAARMGFRSILVVALSARGRTLGALTLISADPRRAYDAQDLATAGEIGHRAALALDNARRARTSGVAASKSRSPDSAIDSSLRRVLESSVAG